jgi:hypothetical protein
LLQLAYADHKRYGCDFNWRVDRALKANDPARSILQPKNNLECGVKILFNQTIVQHKPLLARSGYKSPGCMRSVNQIRDRQVGHYEVRAGRRETG